MPTIDMTPRWCVAPSDEAVAYGDTSPREPWRCVIEQFPNGAIKALWLCEDGSLDDDPNASAYVAEDALYDSEADAWRAFIRNSLDHHKGVLNAIMESWDSIKRATKALDKLESTPNPPGDPQWLGAPLNPDPGP